MNIEQIDVQAQAAAVLDKVKDELTPIWLGGRQRMVLEREIAAAIIEAEARGWTSYADEVERCKDIALAYSNSLTIEVLYDLLQYGRQQAQQRRVGG
jgi:hypothetical protein